LFAARVSGVDLRQKLSDADFTTIRAAFERHLVLVFPDQTLDDDAQIAFSERFGPLEISRPGVVGGGTKLVVVTNIGPDGSIVPPTAKQVLNSRGNQFWHADSSFKPVPALASMLSARILPPSGGDTEFASMRAAYAALPEADKAAIEGKVAIHDFAWSRARADPALLDPSERALLPPVRQAVVLDHGEYGRSLYLGAHARRIEGMDEAESAALIARLNAFATDPRFVYVNRWLPGDAVLWHNRAVLHRATPFSGQAAKRRMVRTTIAGPGPTVSGSAIAA
jgi:alpha-ketoglutarate-dependent 2,4-dichlorophenoxyacetate dioxygenase